MNREAWRAAIHGVSESDMTERLNWAELSKSLYATLLYQQIQSIEVEAEQQQRKNSAHYFLQDKWLVCPTNQCVKKKKWESSRKKQIQCVVLVCILVWKIELWKIHKDNLENLNIALLLQLTQKLVLILFSLIIVLQLEKASTFQDIYWII